MSRLDYILGSSRVVKCNNSGKIDAIDVQLVHKFFHLFAFESLPYNTPVRIGNEITVRVTRKQIHEGYVYIQTVLMQKEFAEAYSRFHCGTGTMPEITGRVSKWVIDKIREATGLDHKTCEYVILMLWKTFYLQIKPNNKFNVGRIRFVGRMYVRSNGNCMKLTIETNEFIRTEFSDAIKRYNENNLLRL